MILMVAATRAGATEWYGFFFEFPHFKYRADQLLGSEARVPNMFHTAVQLNDYVRELQQSGRLENKPVVYDLFSSAWRPANEVRKGRQRFTVEVYETEAEYRINANFGQDFMLDFDRDELVRIVDYFASDSFEPFFCDTTMNRIDLSRELLFKKIDAASPSTHFEEKDEYEVYSTEEWSVRMVGGDFYVFRGGEKIDVALAAPVVEPVVMNERLIVLSGERFSVFEGARCIKSLHMPAIQWTEGQDESNDNSRIRVYPRWLNIHTYDPYNARYSYSYWGNRFYNLRD